MSDGVVIGVDVGTTSVKAVAHRADGTVVASADRGYPLHSPRPGWSEQDPDQVVDAVLTAIADVVASAGHRAVAAIGLGTVMHSLIGLDGDDHALTPMLTFADSRAWPQAQRIRRDTGFALYHATGTPLHPMAPLAKLLWFHEERPDLCRRVRRWVSIKEHLLRRLCDSDVVDHAVASATGLFGIETLDWHPEALALAHVDAGQLGQPVPTSTVLEHLTPGAAEQLGLDPQTPVVIGASDGVLANLGVGALDPTVAALTIGTSGAIRVTVPQPRTDPDMRTFCYALTGRRWVLGGAISNGGLVLQWAHNLFGGDDYDAMVAEAGRIAPGSGGLVMLPYLTGERAPRWTPLHGGVLFGLRVEHERGHVVRAALEGVALQLRLVADALRDAGAELHRLRVTGGFVASDLWLQIVADVLDAELEVPDVNEAVAWGAALLAMDGVDMIDDLDVACDQLAIARAVAPETAAVGRYDRVAGRYANLTEHLEPLLGDAALTGADEQET
ncbi:MAG TPA: gluconokinase [Euzebyales bacterium]|nr:gluconokinase [Euzebyales bacterium]